MESTITQLSEEEKKIQLERERLQLERDRLENKQMKTNMEQQEADVQRNKKWSEADLDQIRQEMFRRNIECLLNVLKGQNVDSETRTKSNKILSNLLDSLKTSL